jgi:hypothetical protein
LGATRTTEEAAIVCSVTPAGKLTLANGTKPLATDSNPATFRGCAVASDGHQLFVAATTSVESADGAVTLPLAGGIAPLDGSSLSTTTLSARASVGISLQLAVAAGRAIAFVDGDDVESATVHAYAIPGGERVEVHQPTRPNFYPIFFAVGFGRAMYLATSRQYAVVCP